MKALYLECNMGAAGDMLTAALLELCETPAEFVNQINQLGIMGAKLIAEDAVRSGIKGTHVSVMIDQEIHSGDKNLHTHLHRSLEEIQQIISKLEIPDTVKKDIQEVYRLLAEAESKAHNTPVSEIHFHEVGMIDAIVDITAVCLLIHALAPDKILASPIHVGDGQIKCAHGILPVPAPATAYLLKGIPTYKKNVYSELCTPTGAALLKYFVEEFGPQPVMKVEKTGYGMGRKTFEEMNAVRASIGEIQRVY